MHWRLDSPNIIDKSTQKGAIIESNVGAGQRMLLSVGSQVPNKLKSKSSNFLGEYQNYINENPEKIREIVNTYNYNKDYPYKISLL